ncbi:uncharacterized protein DS421_2g54030 [Arachis hypogaea]|nr:uncharacterized protein DS421_2g54030 [Arachis hypogaea]
MVRGDESATARGSGSDGAGTGFVWDRVVGTPGEVQLLDAEQCRWNWFGDGDATEWTLAVESGEVRLLEATLATVLHGPSQCAPQCLPRLLAMAAVVGCGVTPLREGENL